MNSLCVSVLSFWQFLWRQRCTCTSEGPGIMWALCPMICCHRWGPSDVVLIVSIAAVLKQLTCSFQSSSGVDTCSVWSHTLQLVRFVLVTPCVASCSLSLHCPLSDGQTEDAIICPLAFGLLKRDVNLQTKYLILKQSWKHRMNDLLRTWLKSPEGLNFQSVGALFWLSLIDLMFVSSAAHQRGGLVSMWAVPGGGQCWGFTDGVGREQQAVCRKVCLYEVSCLKNWLKKHLHCSLGRRLSSSFYRLKVSDDTNNILAILMTKVQEVIKMKIVHGCGH